MNTILITVSNPSFRGLFPRGSALHQSLRALKRDWISFLQRLEQPEQPASSEPEPEDDDGCAWDDANEEHYAALAEQIDELERTISGMQGQLEAKKFKLNEYPTSYEFMRSKLTKEINMLRGHILTEQKKLKGLKIEAGIL